MKRVIGLFCMLCLLYSCQVNETNKLELPSVISSGMVLQRNTEVTLWGSAAPGKNVTLTPSWGQKQKVQCNEQGDWKVKIKTLDAGGPYTLTIQSGDSTLLIEDILMGEVWLCSGQSNMEMPLRGWPPNDTILNSRSEIANANYPEMRLFTVARNISPKPLKECQGAWSACTPESAATFSATAFFFGKELYQHLKVPIGLIHSSWGGTPAESWTNAEFLSDIPAYQGIENSLIEAQASYDSLYNWMADLKNEYIEKDNENYYAELNLQEEKFATADLDDSSWPLMPVPGLWETSAMPGFDGIVWLRAHFIVPESMVNRELALNLGPIDDRDVTYINGTKVGETMGEGKYNIDRSYTIPAGILHAGENILAVCVIDHGGGGGPFSLGKLEINDYKGQKIILNGDWSYMPLAQILGDKIYFYNEDKNYASQPKLEMVISAYTATTLYNAMINPLLPFTIKGAIWYQGEANVGRGYEYRTLFPTMIRCWREVWGEGDFPFYYVQIAPYNYSEQVISPTAELREAQLLSMQVPNTGMIVTTDIGNPANIHPANKTDVGKRLSLWALAKDYGYDSLVYCGPLYDSLVIEGDKARVYFDHTEGGLLARGGDLTYFEIAGADQKYYPASARIVGETVEVKSEKVKDPVAVRFGWSDIAEPNLFNGAGLPASPFRSDDWKRLSE